MFLFSAEDKDTDSKPCLQVLAYLIDKNSFSLPPCTADWKLLHHRGLVVKRGADLMQLSLIL